MLEGKIGRCSRVRHLVIFVASNFSLEGLCGDHKPIDAESSGMGSQRCVSATMIHRSCGLAFGAMIQQSSVRSKETF